MWRLICNAISTWGRTPSVNDVISTLEQHSVCTNVQCFETLSDAGFGAVVEGHSQHGNLMGAFFVFLIFLTFMHPLLVSAPRSASKAHD